MAVYKREDRDGWWWYRRVVRLPNGSRKRIHARAPANTKRSAEDAERAHIDRLTHPERHAVDAPAPTTATVAEFAKTFLETYVATQNKPRVQRDKARILDSYLIPEFGERPIGEITVLDLERLRAKLLKTRKSKYTRAGREDLELPGRNRKTVNNIMGVMSRMLNYAQEVGEIDVAPRLKILKTDTPAFRFLDDTELQALLSFTAKEPLWRAAVLLGVDAGLRIGELRGLRWADWNKREGMLHIQRSADISTNEIGTTKGWNHRKIPLTGRLAKALKAIRRPTKLVFCDQKGKMLNYELFRWNLPRLLRVAEVDPATWHDLRHTFCSHLAMKGAPAKAIQELAGHTELSTTLKYMHLTKGAKQSAISLLESHGLDGKAKSKF